MLVVKGKYLFFQQMTTSYYCGFSEEELATQELDLDGEEDGNTKHGNHVLPECLSSLRPLPFSLKEAILINSWRLNMTKHFDNIEN